MKYDSIFNILIHPNTKLKTFQNNQMMFDYLYQIIDKLALCQF